MKNLSKNKLNKLDKDRIKLNKQLRQSGRHDDQMSLEEYVEYIFGKKKYKPSFKPLKQTSRRQDKRYPSLNTSGSYATPLPEKKVYTGTLVKGISTMHKSNAVPVISEEEAKSHSNMRR